MNGKTIAVNLKDLSKTELVGMPNATCVQLLSKNRLIICYPSNKFLVHNLVDGTLVASSQKQAYPTNYLSRFNRIYGAFELQGKIVLYTHYTYISIDLEDKVPKMCRIESDKPTS